MAEIDRVLHIRGLKSNCPVLLNGQIGIIEDQGQETLVFGTVAGNKYVPSGFDFNNFKQDILDMIGDTNNLITVNKVIVNAINELVQSGGVGSGSGGTVNYTTYTYTATADNTTSFEIVNNGIYDPTKDYIQLYLKGVMLQPTVDYTINDLVVTLNTFTLNNSESIFMLIFKTEEMNGTNLVDGTVQKQKFEASVQTTLTNADKIGDLSTLETTAKDTIVGAINENTTSLSDNTSQLRFLEQLKLRFVYNILGDGSDESSKIQNAINNTSSGNTIFIPKGIYCFKNVTIDRSLYFKGYGGAGIDDNGTTIKLATGGTYIFKYTGTSSSILNGGGIEGIRFDGVSQSASYLIRAEWISHLFVEKSGFNNVNGSAISLQRVMESGIFKSYFRKCGSDTTDVIYLDSVVNSVITYNVNNLHIEENTFGGNNGRWIGSANDSNLDAIWICRNKFEYDSTPTWANSSTKAVISLGQVNRCSIDDNTFYNFLDSNNHYSKIFEFINGSGVVTLTKNKINSCSGTWLTTSSPRIISKQNEALSSTLTVNCTSPLAQDIDEIISRNSDGSIQILSSKINNFISSHYLGGVQKRTFNYDANSLSYCKTVKSSTAQFDEMGRINVSSYVGFYNTTLTLKVRVKAISSDTVVDAYLDGTSLGTVAVAYANGWIWASFVITVASITSNSTVKIRQSATNPMLFDGYIII
jgi:hypothetical protein